MYLYESNVYEIQGNIYEIQTNYRKSVMQLFIVLYLLVLNTIGDTQQNVIRFIRNDNILDSG